MTRATDVTNLDAVQQARLDADIEFVTDYLAGEASPEVMLEVNERLRTDEVFYNNVAPLIEAWAVPFRFGIAIPVDVAADGETGASGAADSLVRYDRFSPEARQAEWDRFLRSMGKDPVPLDVIEAGLDGGLLLDPNVVQRKARRPRPRWQRWVRGLVFAVGGLAVAFVALVLGIVFFVRPQVSTFQAGAAADSAGRSLPPGGTLWKPTIHDTKPGEERVIAMDNALVTLYSESRLAIGTDPVNLIGKPSTINAIDGAAWVTVPPYKVFTLSVADVLFVCPTGRYHVAHPLKGPTQIYVDRGHIWLTPRMKRNYKPGTVITIQTQDTLTIVSAASLAGGQLLTDTLKNLAKNRFAHPARPKS